ncbi:MAG: VanZ family protein [Candidatus Marinimicrobia bacterium]|nr:VanZ family protein [Candidatus Neomarinimicrobiota bacterium]
MNVKYKIPAILYSILIFFLSSIPQSKLPPVRLFSFDKIVHLIEYLLYGMTLMLAYSRSTSDKIIHNAFKLSLMTGIIYAATDEIHQLYVPGRDCSIFDFAADAAGVFLGVYLFSKIIKHKTGPEELIYQSTTHK